MRPPNGLALSGAATIDRDDIIAESGAQNRYDLARRERRPLQRLVRPPNQPFPESSTKRIHTPMILSLVSWAIEYS